MTLENRTTLSMQHYAAVATAICSIPSSATMALILVDCQLDAQNSYLFTYNTFIKILYMFRPTTCPSSGELIV